MMDMDPGDHCQFKRPSLELRSPREHARIAGIYKGRFPFRRRDQTLAMSFCWSVLFVAE